MLGQLDRSHADIWLIDQDAIKGFEAGCLNVLSTDERDRYNSFYFEKDKRHFLASRFALRQLLSSYLEEQPEEIKLAYTSFEKPYLPGSSVYFNVTHAFGQALVAIAHWPIGIDIEWSLREVELDELASRFFSKQEAKVFLDLDTSLKQRYFFHVWTRKEAVIKALGDGFSYPLDAFHVSVHPDQNVLTFDDQGQSSTDWTLRTISLPDKAFVAAYAVQGMVNDHTLRPFNFAAYFG